MRIVCQKCAAAYAIDDKLITPKGVRAQCPRCRNLQLVKKEPSAQPQSPAAAPAPASSSPPVPDEAPQPAAPAAASDDDSDLFDFGSPPPGLMPFPKEGEASRSAQGASSPAPGFGGDLLSDLLEPPPSAPPAAELAPPRRPSSSTASVRAAPPVDVATSGCRECGKPLVDPFDQALGVCDGCRQQTEGSAPGPDAPESSQQAVEFRGPPPGALPTEPAEPRASPRSASRPAVQPRPPVRPAPRSSGRGALVGGLAAVLLLGGGGGYYFLQVKPRLEEEARQRAKPPEPSPLPEAVQAVLPRWQLQFLDLSGTSAELLAQGQQRLGMDQRLSYAEAEELFQQALLQDPRNDAALAGYVQALALGRGPRMDEASFTEARALIEAAQQRAGRTPPVLLAHANLLLARPRDAQHLEKARQLANLALETGSEAEKAEAHLVLGRAYLSTSMGLANQHFDSALQLAPGLRRVHYYRALAYEAAGDYAQALEGLQRRLELDARHWDSLEATGRIYQEVGEVQRASGLYEARLKDSPKDARARLALAALRYQSEGNAAGAVRELRALLKGRSSLPAREVAEVLVHLAAAERLAGNAEAAERAGREALELDKTQAAAHLQLFLVALGRRDAAGAGTHLDALKGQLEDPALERVLEGRLLLLEGKASEALARFLEAAQLDERRHDALLLAGVAAAADKRRDEALRHLFQALVSDPLRPSPHRLATLLYLNPLDTLSRVEGGVLALASIEEDFMPRLYEGLLRFHQGELGAAERLFQQVLEVDAGNAGATAYLSLVALRRGEGAQALALGARAVALGRQMPIAHLAHGLALAEAKKVEPARRALRDALGLDPKLLSAEVRLAELEAVLDKESARARLVRVMGLDPSFHSARRALFMLDQRG